MNPFEVFRAKKVPVSYGIVDSMASIMARRLAEGGTVLACGNGGSAEQANHFVAELVGRFIEEKRRALNAISLCANTAVLTALANDFGYEEVFRRQVEAHGRPRDVLLVLSTSGTSENVLRAAEYALKHNLVVFGMCGHHAKLTARSVVTRCHQVHIAQGFNAQTAQEDHLRALHRLAEKIETEICERDRRQSNGAGPDAKATNERPGQEASQA